MTEKIDFVILWVDGNDQKWLKEKEEYELKIKGSSSIDASNIRYRDWENLKYWFRGVEKYAPWVNKIHFITCGHLPEWLNEKNPKLNIVKHSDYMPLDSLPTFNSNSIELLINKIPNLEEKFVLFNDDMFLIKKVNPSDFFKNNLPCNSMALCPIIPSFKSPFNETVSNNVKIINKYFNFDMCKKKNMFKYLSLKQNKYLLKSLSMYMYHEFSGFCNFHLPLSYLKTTFDEVWNLEESTLKDTVYSKFRDYDKNVSHWLFNYWQFASGKFYPKSIKFGVNLSINDKKVHNIIRKQKYKTIGLGDIELKENFEIIKQQIIDDFEEILPEKSSYEK